MPHRLLHQQRHRRARLQVDVDAERRRRLANEARVGRRCLDVHRNGRGRRDDAQSTQETEAEAGGRAERQQPQIRVVQDLAVAAEEALGLDDQNDGHKADDVVQDRVGDDEAAAAAVGEKRREIFRRDVRRSVGEAESDQAWHEEREQAEESAGEGDELEHGLGAQRRREEDGESGADVQNHG